MGRFAPSPTGPLHFGSLVAAAASYLDARHHGGSWLVRIENLDPPRERAGAADDQLLTLERLGFEWDGVIVRQSERTPAYREAAQRLRQLDQAYFCRCSRKDIAHAGAEGIEGPVYPGTCRDLDLDDAEGRALRLLTHEHPIGFKDRIFGQCAQQIATEVGDFVVRRADGLFAYQIAVVVDDAWQGVTHVVRGADLLASTPRQIYLQRLLGYAQPHYAHVPLVTDAQGQKLSKRDGAYPLDLKKPRETLAAALRFLGQTPPQTADKAAFWAEAAENWDLSALRRKAAGMQHSPGDKTAP